MKRIIAATLLAACSQYADPGPAIVTQITDPSDLEGTWCNTDLCLEVGTTVFGPGTMIYKWTADGCREEGFMGLDASRRIQLGPLFPERGCYNGIDQSGAYTATAELRRGGMLTVELSVWYLPIELRAE